MVPSFKDVNSTLSTILIKKKIETRKGATLGLYICPLLPLSYIICRLNLNKWTECDEICIQVCFAFLVNSFVSVLQVVKNNKLLDFWSLIISSASTISLFFLYNGSYRFCIAVFLSTFFYQTLVLHLMKLCPKNFTYGESALVSQGIILFFLSCYYGQFNTGDCFSTSSKVLQIGIFLLIFIYILSSGFNLSSKPLAFYVLVIVALTVIMIPVNMAVIGENPYMWIFNFIFSSQDLIQLVVYWSFCSLIGSLLVYFQTMRKTKANTVMRKTFHALTVVVFLPGFLVNPCFMYLSSGVVFALLFGLDIVRVLNIPPVGEALEKGYQAFSDEKDCGLFALTPIYLLVGCSMPVWIHPNPTPDNLLPLLSGLLTIGIGDSAASLFGTLFGKHFWPGSRKTKEGSVGCFLSQLFFILVLINFDLLPKKNLIRAASATLITSLVEAWTDQVDNIVLPLIMFIIVAI